MKLSTYIFLIVTAVILAIAWPQKAQATTMDDAYLSVLAEEGIRNVKGDAGLIGAAHEICDLRAAGYSEYQVIRKVDYYSQLDLNTSGFLVGAAEQAYCPWAA